METGTIIQVSPKRKSISVDEIIVLEKPSLLLTPFDHRTVDVLDRISKSIMHSKQLNGIAEMAACAFWLRKANMTRFIHANPQLTENKDRKILPVGLVFHICPSNVDTMFLYSLALSLLMGNRNIVRVSQRQNSPVTDRLFDLINDVIQDEEEGLFTQYISIITYAHDAAINAYLSAHADARMIWGGDETIRTFKNIPAAPHTKDIVFADRVSYALFKSAEYLALGAKEKSSIAAKFYNASYSFHQKGCSCPQAIFILGSSADNRMFEHEFYVHLKNTAGEKYHTDSYSLASLKLNQLAGDAIDGKITDVLEEDSLVVFARLNNEAPVVAGCGGGFFYTRQLEQLEDLLPYVNSKVQTLSHFGLDDTALETIGRITAGIGIDRMVPVGQALDFHYLWDGYNLFDELSVKRLVS